MLGEELADIRVAPSPGDVKETIQRLLFSSAGRLSLFFETLYAKAVGRSTVLAATLDAVADGPVTTAGVAARIRCVPHDPLALGG